LQTLQTSDTIPGIQL